MADMLNINSDELVKFTNKLEKIGKYDLPVAVRGTLNETAFRMKGSGGERGEIDKQAHKEFDHIRSKSLFKAMSGVTKARGNDIASMSSISGIIVRSGRDEIAEGLAQQETGGSVDSGSTPTNQARISNSLSKKVRRKNYLRSIVPVNLTRNTGNRFMKRINQSIKNNRAIMFKSRSGITYVANVKKINRGQNVKPRIDMTILYRINNEPIKLRIKRPFISQAAQVAGKRIPVEFLSQAKKRIDKKFMK